MAMQTSRSEPAPPFLARKWLENSGWLPIATLAPDLAPAIADAIAAGAPAHSACWASLSAALWQFCGSANELEQTIAYTTLSAWLRKIIGRLCDDANTADDATQWALMAIHQGLRTVAKTSSFLSFCKVTAQRQAIRLCLKRSNLDRITDSVIDLESDDPVGESIVDRVPDKTLDVENDFALELANLGLWKCFFACRLLSPRQMQIMVLICVYEKPQLKIANQLGLTPTALYVDLHRAKEKLRSDKSFVDCLARAGAIWSP